MGAPVLPLWRQNSFAFYADGTESGSALIGGVDTNPSLDVDTLYQCRFVIQEYNGANKADLLTLRLQYNLNAAGWVNVSTSTPIQYTSVGTIADGGVTTQRIGAGTFVAGRVFEAVNDTVTVYSTAGNDETEALFGLTIDSAQVANTDTIQLQVLQGTGTVLDTYTITPSITVVEASSISVPIGLTTESSLAQQAALPLIRLINQSLASDLTQAISAASALNIPVGLASETDLPQPIAIKKTLLLGLLSETNASLAVVALKLLTLGLPSEAAATLPLNALKKVILGLTPEAEESFTLTKEKRKLLDIVNENTVNFSLVGATAVSLGLPTQTEIGQTLLSLKALQLELTNEINSTQAFSKLKSLLLNFIAEIELPQSTTFSKTYPAISQVGSTELGQTAAIPSEIPIAQTQELNTGEILFSIGGTTSFYFLSAAGEALVAANGEKLALTSQALSLLITQILETNTGQPLGSSLKTFRLIQAAETNTSQAILPATATEVLQVTETSSTNPVTKLKEKVLTLVAEADLSLPASKPINKVLSLTTETSTASSTIIPLGLTINNAVEVSLAQLASEEYSHTISKAVEADTPLSLQLTIAIDVATIAELNASTSGAVNYAIILNNAVELESGTTLSKEKTYSLTEALETNLAFLATNPDAIDWCLANKTLTLVAENKYTLTVTFSSNTVTLP